MQLSYNTLVFNHLVSSLESLRPSQFLDVEDQVTFVKLLQEQIDTPLGVSIMSHFPPNTTEIDISHLQNLPHVNVNKLFSQLLQQSLRTFQIIDYQQQISGNATANEYRKEADVAKAATFELQRELIKKDRELDKLKIRSEERRVGKECRL